MQHNHGILGHFHLLLVQNVAVLEADVVLLVEEALRLHPGHVEDVQLADDFLQSQGLNTLNTCGTEHLVGDVLGNLQLRRIDEDEFVVLVPAHGLGKAVDGAAEFQVTAQADGVSLKSTLQ